MKYYEVEYMGGSPLRFTGLFSGMDTQSMVQQLMRAESMRTTRLNTRRQQLIWRQEDVRTTITNLDSFRATNTDVLTGRLSGNAWNTMQTTVTNNANGSTSNPGFSVTAGINAPAGSMQVVVHNVADRDVIRGDAQFRGTANPTANHPTVDLNSTVASFGFSGETITITVGGTDHDIDMTGVNTVQQFMDRVNQIDGVTMSFDNFAGRFQLSGDNIGAGNTIRTNDSGVNGLMSSLGLNDVGNGDSRLINNASNAILTMNGVDVEQTSNNFTLNGLTFNLTNAIFPPTSGGTPPDPVSFTVETSQNFDDLVDAMRSFVSDFNNLMRHLNDQHSTARPRSGSRTFFDPLTDEQRREMSDREVELWEAQARAGMLHRDQDMRNIQSQLRQWVMQPLNIGGQQISLSHIGISTGYGTGNDRLIGMLNFDEEHFRRALEGGPAANGIGNYPGAERIQELFTHVDPFPQGTQINNAARTRQNENSGILTRLNNIITNATGSTGTLRARAGVEGTVSESQNQMSRRIQDYDARLERMQEMLSRREAHFFAMFARMEQAMAQSQQQMDSLWAFAGM